jgi:membrane protein implicated in regulation of membrane protease activity
MDDSTAVLVWLGVALGLGIVETLTVDFTFLMFAGGALGGAGAAALGVGVPGQVVTASVLSVLLLGLVRPLLKRRFTHGVHEAIGTAAQVGRSAEVIEPVTATSGRVRLAGEIWSARSDTDLLVAGEQAVVVRIDGATAVVARPALPQDAP